MSGGGADLRGVVEGVMKRLERLHCGVITTGVFREFLKAWHEDTAGGNFGLVPQLEYVRCATGERAGQSWISLIWQPLKGVRAHEIFELDGVKVYLPKNTRTALKDRCLDVENGTIAVR